MLQKTKQTAASMGSVTTTGPSRSTWATKASYSEAAGFPSKSPNGSSDKIACNNQCQMFTPKKGRSWVYLRNSLCFFIHALLCFIHFFGSGLEDANVKDMKSKVIP
jgi:hypothetical protein